MEFPEGRGGGLSWEPILENPEGGGGGGIIRKIPSMGGVWIFSGTTQCDWLIELPDNKLSNNNLASELVENRSFFKPFTIEEMVIFMINNSTTSEVQR